MSLNVQNEKTSKAGFFTVVGAVFWSFLGIRRRQDYESDAASISLKQVVIAGIIGGIIFVVGVVVLVNVIVANIGMAN
ncbi:MAG: DUF2970 domain-containing protein [Rugosibacter sp.]|nr:MAG: DUF2970 domain-containing protein [Rugosibacter sp.]TBR09058.1 MAG: DUF2970 domain-containing protein [Rugosibacter sp.]